MTERLTDDSSEVSTVVVRGWGRLGRPSADGLSDQMIRIVDDWQCPTGGPLIPLGLNRRIAGSAVATQITAFPTPSWATI